MIAKLVNDSPLRLTVTVLFLIIVVLNSTLKWGIDFNSLLATATGVVAFIWGETKNPTVL